MTYYSKKSWCNSKQQGFTLIELSLVLGIIALLTGGVIFGQFLVQIAQLRKDVRVINDYSTAFYTFRQKYNCIPGDCAGSKFNLSFDGNADGQIGTGSGFDETKINCSSAQEFANVNKHLLRAGMLALRDYDASAINNCMNGKVNNPIQFGGAICAYSTIVNNRHVFRTCDGTDGNIVSLTNAPRLTPQAAYMMDSKLDDGMPRSGKMHGAVYQAMNSTGMPVYSYSGCVRVFAGRYEYQSDSVLLDTNGNGVETGCPMVFFDAW